MKSKLCLLILIIGCIANANPALSFLSISDIHLSLDKQTTMQIDPSSPSSNNDLDLLTFNQLSPLIQQKIAKTHPQFIILLGDIAGHHRVTETSLENNERAVFKKILQVTKNIPVFYVFGNDDSPVANYGPFMNQQRLSPYVIAEQAGWHNGFLSSGQFCKHQKQTVCLLNENSEQGYYAARIASGLRLIALNSVLFSDKTLDSPRAAEQELAWLAQQLQQAQADKDKVILAMHIPFGMNVYDGGSYWQETFTQQFLKLYEQYHPLIIASLVGHTHMEEIKVIKASEKVIGAEYYTAALSTSHGNSPSIKTFNFTKHKHWHFKNYVTYQLHLLDQRLVLNKLYDFKAYYCTTNANKACLNTVTVDKMQNYYTVNNPNYSGGLNYPDYIFLDIDKYTP
jgi:3',5'-cyclic AMP phosphodiesterase CpdA